MIPPALQQKFLLVIYGSMGLDSTYSERVKDLASRYPNVSFEGTYPHAETAQIFSNVDVLIVPSLWYDFPLIIQEAFATQTPVIATNLAGMAEVVEHEKSGLLFERGNAKELAIQIQRIMNEPGLLNNLSRGVPEVMSIQNHVEYFKKIYEQVVQNNRDKRGIQV